jgi:hypothetical protein
MPAARFTLASASYPQHLLEVPAFDADDEGSGLAVDRDEHALVLRECHEPSEGLSCPLEG